MGAHISNCTQAQRPSKTFHILIRLELSSFSQHECPESSSYQHSPWGEDKQAYNVVYKPNYKRISLNPVIILKKQKAALIPHKTTTLKLYIKLQGILLINLVD